MITDKLLMFSEAQAVTDTAASTDVIDLGPIDGNRRDIGVGYPLEFWALVNEAATASGEATVNIQLQTSENNSSWSTIYDSGALAKASRASAGHCRFCSLSSLPASLLTPWRWLLGRQPSLCVLPAGASF